MYLNLSKAQGFVKNGLRVTSPAKRRKLGVFSLAPNSAKIQVTSLRWCTRSTTIRSGCLHHLYQIW